MADPPPVDPRGQVLTRVDGTVGLVTLNRPTVINALNHAMVSVLHRTLTAWAHDPAITAVVLSGAGDRGLCAGGDVVEIYHSALGDGCAARRFWYDEYQLNAYISRYPKPYVALMDGIVMGGGVGLSAHANTRVVTDRTRVAMPEVRIGLIPDVGGTYLLSRAPGRTGLHVGLTGASFTGADAIALGFADHYVPHNALTHFTAAIVSDGVDAALAAHAEQPRGSQLAQHPWIDECYAGDTVAQIVSALRAHGDAAAHEAARQIVGHSPTAVAVTLEAIRRAAHLDTLEDALSMEYRTSTAALRSHDLREGIRAQVIDKDRAPRWAPAEYSAVSTATVHAYFAGAAAVGGHPSAAPQ
ncbi:3-hydroxyisobutyryl-CoA hydrolase [Mycolicibacterium murale]|uniref:3-hydroxyisobutyryl-CoA hydrolase n=1 Tax=Mycolicibacterium murale TaxID=182220 RepID=A0A7I9WL56_9MYCO|nr:enoyl-CoA hydratase/isomerase family protein [Mycolicibacterium murale]MCV7185380.1 enoyl-CoA hydratase/isomerase family protein [Mycolicibacterium murale]GFG57937.1 3-hydroxyisobutyryl-CoA hydrolase [Mycolicibacterium murale]